MLSNLIPDYIRIQRLRLRYKWAELDTKTVYRVLLIDRKKTVIMDKRLNVVGTVLTKDIQVVRGYTESY